MAANRLIKKVHILLVYLLVEGDSIKVIRSIINGQIASSAVMKDKAEWRTESVGGKAVLDRVVRERPW